MTDTPIFIVGTPRSGTTLLQRLIGSHSEVAVPGAETHYFNRYWRQGGRDRALRGEAATRSYLGRVLAGPEVGAMNFTEAERTAMHRTLVDHDALTHGVILGTIMQSYADKHGRPRWAEKTPPHLHFVPVIAREFPSARFVCLVRDPRDVSLSWRKVPWNRSNVAYHTTRWRMSAALSKRFSTEYADRFMTVRYEDLTRDPATILAAICEHLDLDFEPSMLEQTNNPSVRAEESSRWTHKKIDGANSMKWRARMPVAEQKLAELIAGPYLAQWGYVPSEGRWSPALAARAAMLVARATIEFATTRDRRYLRSGRRSVTAS